MSELLEREEMIKEFRNANQEKMTSILKQAMIKPEVLAEMLENDVLNRRTRKSFVDSLMEQQKIGRIYKDNIEKSKKETPLSEFFD